MDEPVLDEYLAMENPYYGFFTTIGSGYWYKYTDKCPASVTDLYYGELLKYLDNYLNINGPKEYMEKVLEKRMLEIIKETNDKMIKRK